MCVLNIQWTGSIQDNRETGYSNVLILPLRSIVLIQLNTRCRNLFSDRDSTPNKSNNKKQLKGIWRVHFSFIDIAIHFSTRVNTTWAAIHFFTLWQISDSNSDSFLWSSANSLPITPRSCEEYFWRDKVSIWWCWWGTCIFWYPKTTTLEVTETESWFILI